MPRPASCKQWRRARRAGPAASRRGTRLRRQGGVAGADAGSTLGGVAKGFSFGDAKESRSTLSSVTSTVGRSVSQGDALAPPRAAPHGGGSPARRRPQRPRHRRGGVRSASGSWNRSGRGAWLQRRPAPGAPRRGQRQQVTRRGRGVERCEPAARWVPFHTKTNRRLDDKRVKTLPGRGRTGTRLRERPPVEAFARCQIHVADLPRRWNWSRSVESLVN